MQKFFYFPKRIFVTTIFCAVLAVYAWIITGGQLPHFHGALESEEQCPLHFFAKQAQSQSFPPPPPVFALSFISDCIPFYAGLTTEATLVVGYSRAPPLS